MGGVGMFLCMGGHTRAQMCTHECVYVCAWMWRPEDKHWCCSSGLVYCLVSGRVLLRRPGACQVGSALVPTESQVQPISNLRDLASLWPSESSGLESSGS